MVQFSIAFFRSRKYSERKARVVAKAVQVQVPQPVRATAASAAQSIMERYRRKAKAAMSEAQVTERYLNGNVSLIAA